MVCELTGGAPVGPSVTTLFWTPSASGFQAAVITFFQALRPYLPPTYTIRVPNTGDTLEDTTGVLTGSWSSGTATNVTGTGDGTYAMGVGFRVVWNTTAFVNGRRQRGSTFFVPSDRNMFNAGGGLTDAAVAVIQTAATALMAGVPNALLVWHRPKDHAGGIAHPAVSATVPDKVTWLRSRRI